MKSPKKVILSVVISALMAAGLTVPSYAEDQPNTSASPQATEVTESPDTESAEPSTEPESSESEAPAAQQTEAPQQEQSDTQEEQSSTAAPVQDNTDPTKPDAEVTIDGDPGKLGLRNMRAPAKAPAPTGIFIESLSTQLFYGADKQNDGTYVWEPDLEAYSSSRDATGHNFAYRINFSVSGVGTASAEELKFEVPAYTLIDRNGNPADSITWSIPSKDDVDQATDPLTGEISTDEIDQDVNYAYYLDGDHYVIYNFRDVPAGDNGYIEMSYGTTERPMSYVDMQKMNPFTCSMTVTHDGKTDSKTADPIVTAINTNAVITSTNKQYPYRGKIKQWNNSWGTEVKPANDTDYYYLVWTIKSNVLATQPYDFKIDDSITSNLGGMTVLGYRFAGESEYHKSNSISDQTATLIRYDSVLTAIPLDTYASATTWQAKNTETATVTPVDKVDPATNKKASQTWVWTKPVFHEPTGHFNGYKRGDGAYRTYFKNTFAATQHYANSLDFKAGEFSRYDLEKFNGYGGEEKTLSEYGNLDFASWMVGYPTPWTRDTSVSSYTAADPSSAYGHKPVMYELTDDDLYLLNDESALLSDNGSKSRTIDNGGIDGSKARKLVNGDYRISKLQFSWVMEDATYDAEETGQWTTKPADLTDNDVIVFYGKFNGSDDWTQFATYNVKTGAASPNSTYVSSMNSRMIIFNDNQNLTGYKVTAANAHYYTEIYTVPFVALKDSDDVMNLIAPKSGDDAAGREIALVNNNTAKVYQLKSGTTYQGTDYQNLMKDSSNWTELLNVQHSDTDYAIASYKESSLTKKVVSTSNNAKRKYYTITWKLDESETMVSGESGTTSYIPQESGVFYDLLPDGSTFVKKSVYVSSNGSTIPASAYSVSTIYNYQGTGRTMVVVKVNQTAEKYEVTFDTRHTWNSIKDYGNDVYNPIAYETGNESITDGFADNGGTVKKDGSANTKAIKDANLLKNLSKNTGGSEETGLKFIYAENSYDIMALTSASSGLTKKIKDERDAAYSYSTQTTVNGNYSYELRFQNSYTSASKNMIFFDSLENFDLSNQKDTGASSDWRGTLQSIDVSQLQKKGAVPVAYISTKENLDPEKDHDVSDTSVWTKVTSGMDLSSAKAVAIDLRKKSDGSDFKLDPGESVVAHLYMKAPSAAPDARSGEDYPYTYNNIYISDTVYDPNDESKSQDFLIHQDYTRASIIITGDLNVHKISAKTKESVKGITFRLYGTSDYGTAVDVQRTSDSSGNMSFEDIEKGSYILQEYKTTDDYLMDATEHTVEIDGSGKTWVDGTEYTDSALKIENQPRIHADVTFNKVDSQFTNTRVGGAQYRLSGRSDYGTDVLMTAISSSDEDSLGRVIFSNVEKGTYSLKEVAAPADHTIDPTEYTVQIDENGNAAIYKKAAEDVYDVTTTTVTKYSHTSNISNDGTQNGNYGSNWNNNNITGSDRETGNSQAHVVTIPGAETLHVRITWGGESESEDYVSVWEGSHPEYTASSDSNSAINIAQKLGGGSHTSSSNTKEFDVNGDSVTFSYRSDGSGSGDGYGYYAVITGEQKVQGELLHRAGDLVEIDRNNSGYYLKDEPLHYFTFTKKSSYDQTIIAGAEFSLTGTSNSGTAVNKSAASDSAGTVRFDALEAGSYVLTETKAPEGYDLEGERHVVKVANDGTYTISGLSKDSSGLYTMYDPRTPKGKITVKKVWDDGRTNHKPTDLAITITTDVPQQSQRQFTVIYDANGGSFGD